MDATKIGYEISFARYIYKPLPLRTVEQIRTDILKLAQQTEGLLHKIVGVAQMAGKKTLTGHWCIGMTPAAMAGEQKTTPILRPTPY
jgi:hypothetical protein